VLLLDEPPPVSTGGAGRGARSAGRGAGARTVVWASHELADVERWPIGSSSWSAAALRAAAGGGAGGGRRAGVAARGARA
jgi:hypothetical protein